MRTIYYINMFLNCGGIIMNRNSSKLKYGMRKLAVGFVSCLLGLSVVFVSNPSSAIAKEEEKTAVVAEKEMSKEEQIKLAKEELKAYLETMNEEVIDNPAIKFKKEEVKEQIKASIKRAKELLEDKDIDDAKLEEIKKIPFKKVNGKKQGLFRDYTHNALVDFEVVGDRTEENPQTKKKYTELKDNKIVIKTSLKDVVKFGEEGKAFINVNYVTKENYDGVKVDAMSTATPKYKKDKLPAENYEIKAIENGYEIEIKKLPENTVLLKPVILAQLANKTYFENGDIVYVKEVKEEKPEEKVEKKEEAKSVLTKFAIGKDELVKVIDGKEESVKMEAAPFIENDRTMLPLRYVAEAIGAEVKYDKETRTATFTKGEIVASIQIDGDKIVLADGKEIVMDTKPVNKNGRIFVSLTNITKVFNLTNGNTDDKVDQDIEWDKETRTVIVNGK